MVSVQYVCIESQKKDAFLTAVQLGGNRLTFQSSGCTTTKHWVDLQELHMQDQVFLMDYSIRPSQCKQSGTVWFKILTNTPPISKCRQNIAQAGFVGFGKIVLCFFSLKKKCMNKLLIIKYILMGLLLDDISDGPLSAININSVLKFPDTVVKPAVQIIGF